MRCSDPVKEIEHRRKISENNGARQPEARAKMSLRKRGVPLTEEHKRNMSIALAGRLASEETRRKMSETHSLAFLEGRHQPHNRSRPERITTLKGGAFRCRSSWEVKYARMLDADPEVVEFLYEAVKVPYYWKGWRNTTPDFFVKRVNGDIELVEVKPLERVRPHSRARARILAMAIFAGKYGFIFRWWDKNFGYLEVPTF